MIGWLEVCGLVSASGLLGNGSLLMDDMRFASSLKCGMDDGWVYHGLLAGKWIRKGPRIAIGQFSPDTAGPAGGP